LHCVFDQIFNNSLHQNGKHYSIDCNILCKIILSFKQLLKLLVISLSHAQSKFKVRQSEKSSSQLYFSFKFGMGFIAK